MVESRIFEMAEHLGYDFGNINNPQMMIESVLEFGDTLDFQNIFGFEYDEECNIFKIDGKEYLVLSSEDAEHEFREREMDLIEDIGLDSFAPAFRDWIIWNCIDTEWFDEAREESHESYIEDIRTESSSDEEYDNRLEEEMAEADCKTEEEFLEYLCSDYENSVEWYIENFGIDTFSHVVKKYDLADWDKVIDEIAAIDGMGGCLATYDGVEIELDNFFAYRIA